MNPNSKNIACIELVAKGLQVLKDRVVFIGGATIELYISGSTLNSIRPTDDVDCIIEIASRVEYHKLENSMRKLGFKNDTTGPICRWIYNGIKVDMMPLSSEILGFSNKWYKDGIQHSKKIRLPSGNEIRILDSTHFLATKIEAFQSRGHDDFYGSKDMEDIITMLDGCTSIRSDFEKAATALKEYMVTQFHRFLSNESFINCISGHLSAPNQLERSRTILALLQDLTASLL